MEDNLSQYVKISGLIDHWRSVVPLDQRWQITWEWLPGDSPTEGMCRWIPGSWGAHVCLHPMLPEGRFPWVIVHELLELSFHELSESWERLLDSVGEGYLKPALHAGHVAAQDRLIESLTRLLLDADAAAEQRGLRVVLPAQEPGDPPQGAQGHGRARWDGEDLFGVPRQPRRPLPDLP